MRPSQYHYLKRMLTRNVHRRNEQKKCLKAKKKELRKQNKLIQKQQRKIERQTVKKSKVNFSSTNFHDTKEHNTKSSLLLFGGIFLGLLAITVSICWFTDISDVYEQVGIVNGLLILLFGLLIFGGPSYLCFYFYIKNYKKDEEIHHAGNSYKFVDNVVPTYASKNTFMQNLKKAITIPKSEHRAKQDESIEDNSNIMSIDEEQHLEEASVKRKSRHSKIIDGIPSNTIDSKEVVKTEASKSSSYPQKTEEFKETDTYIKSKKFSDAFAALCVANCELDKKQNYVNEITDGNVRYNDKRFDELIDDPLVKQMISRQKIKEISEKIIEMYNGIGLRVIVDDVKCTTQYVVLELKPMNGARIDDILSFQNNIEYVIEMKTLMNVMYKKGYIGILLPIQNFIQCQNPSDMGKL